MTFARKPVKRVLDRNDVEECFSANNTYRYISYRSPNFEISGKQQQLKAKKRFSVRSTPGGEAYTGISQTAVGVSRLISIVKKSTIVLANELL